MCIRDRSNYGLFVAADASQLKEVNRRAEIDAIGTMCTEGIIKGNENGGFVCMDETARKMLPYNKEYELKEGKDVYKRQEQVKESFIRKLQTFMLLQ